MKELIQHDPRLATARDENGYTPLCDAVRCGSKEVVDLLLAFGVDPNAASDKEWNPLTLALRLDNRVAIMSRLLSTGADVNAVDGACGDTLLHEAVTKNRPEIVRLLLEAGADPDAKNKFGHTPLSEALETEASAAKDLAFYTSMASIRTDSAYDSDEIYKRSKLKQATEIVEMLKECSTDGPLLCGCYAGSDHSNRLSINALQATPKKVIWLDFQNQPYTAFFHAKSIDSFRHRQGYVQRVSCGKGSA